MTRPGKHKMALITWLVVYPMITVLLAALEPVLSEAAMPLRTLVLSVIMVPAMVYGVMPFATARLGWWLNETSGPRLPRSENPDV
ncbi:hypothetical protein [Roseibium sp.]|uniref:hypothetical protein n=1 Tax=Roseibium sp. TaxID=1936156 RepID=UPI003BAC3C9B